MQAKKPVISLSDNSSLTPLICLQMCKLLSIAK